MSNGLKSSFVHLKKYIFRGILALIPPVLTFLVLRLLYVGIDQKVTRIIERIIGFSIPGLGILLVLVVIYFVGVIASNMIGRQIFGIIEKIVSRIPLLNTTYQVGKQLSVTLALPERQVFKRVVLVEYLKQGMWTVGFVTGAIHDRGHNDEILLKVYIPTPPMPTSGTMVLVRESQTRDPGWTIEEAMKIVISGGIIGPDQIQ
ncbi:MAG: DUF502 domain-containing protein [Calditrichia bacterium]